jgi:tyrosinase
VLGYGGPISGFDQQGNAYGAIESDPHNFVHVMVGGDTPPNPTGWMFDPAFAALDPIFWVHHCNIDRLWAAWLTVQSNEQERTQPWQNGPFPRQFTMPTPGDGLEVFTPGETLPGERLAPEYDSLTSGTGIAPPSPDLAAMTGPPSSKAGASALIGANDRTLTVSDSPVRSEIALIPEPEEPGFASTADRAERIFLNVEGVRGNAASGVLNAVITAPGEDAHEGAEQTLVFFGLQKATITDGFHAGNGLSATVDVTEKVRALQAASGEPLEKLEVVLAQPTGASGEEITVDRVSLYRRRGG